MGGSMDVIKATLADFPRDIAYVGMALVLLVIATVLPMMFWMVGLFEEKYPVPVTQYSEGS